MQQPARLRTACLVAMCAPVIAWAAPATAGPAAAGATTVVDQLGAQGMTSTDRPRIGVALDVGVPDGATASLVYRPLRALRVEAGLSHNLISLGGRGSV